MDNSAETPSPGGASRRRDGRAPWRAAGIIGVTSLGYPAGIGLVDPLLGVVAFGAELLVALLVIAIVLFGSQARTERAFRLLRWVADRPEPPGPVAVMGNDRPLHCRPAIPSNCLKVVAGNCLGVMGLDLRAKVHPRFLISAGTVSTAGTSPLVAVGRVGL